ncbi:hypothetical protein [Kribbia dieselivorans]|uniref:hypothetical protein n=1 Tax=Kribbia dieselivorans TaxID=331526 RepID=UPI000839995B|nr:hypothetical protein [Kribbia dieselivorans]
MISPRLVKGGIVQVDPVTGAMARTIALQYNPDTLTRTLKVQGSGDTGDRSQALRLTGPAVETLKLEAEIDATDRLEFPDQNPAATQSGIHAQLAALETLIQPTTDQMTANHALAGAGVLEVLPMQAPLTVFVWGKGRVVPVRITDLSITEEAFDTHLNPIRARVTLGMRVLSVDDLGFDHRGGALHLGYLRGRESLARGAGSPPLSQLGIEGV